MVGNEIKGIMCVSQLGIKRGLKLRSLLSITRALASGDWNNTLFMSTTLSSLINLIINFLSRWTHLLQVSNIIVLELKREVKKAKFLQLWLRQNNKINYLILIKIGGEESNVFLWTNLIFKKTVATVVPSLLLFFNSTSFWESNFILV